MIYIDDLQPPDPCTSKKQVQVQRVLSIAKKSHDTEIWQKQEQMPNHGDPLYDTALRQKDFFIISELSFATYSTSPLISRSTWTTLVLQSLTSPKGPPLHRWLDSEQKTVELIICYTAIYRKLSHISLASIIHEIPIVRAVIDKPVIRLTHPYLWTLQAVL